MFFTILIYTLPYILMFWLVSKVLSGFLGMYVMSYGSEAHQEQLAKNDSFTSRIGLMLAVVRSNAVSSSTVAPKSASLREALDQLEVLKVERETLEIRKEIDSLRNGHAPAALPSAAGTVAAVALPVAASATAVSLGSEVTTPLPEEEVEDREVPQDQTSVIRDPSSGDLITA